MHQRVSGYFWVTKLHYLYRGTAFKWLDVVALFDRLLHDQDPTTDLLHVRHFTDPALGRLQYRD
ncbi:hypothetical protein XcvCFBP7111P_12650 [Xanthomonas citri pv. vignicola]|uniref:Transposase n=1 Tax=Xanthomonas citri pv. vignicola TaxID=473426 RepID=A0AB33CGP3_XANCI|nr:hypothetical protein XcvCFBP7111P_12650 [Xanthomonas citri pv. vignicola]